jgi:hypothetical protein
MVMHVWLDAGSRLSPARSGNISQSSNNLSRLEYTTRIRLRWIHLFDALHWTIHPDN